MMKWLWSLILIFLYSCGGRLTYEQRQDVKRFIAANEIKKIPKATITTAALAYGDSIATHIYNKKVSYLEKEASEDTFSKIYGVTIRLLHPDDQGLTKVEQQILTAYETASPQGGLMHNVQDVGKDAILYTVPATNMVKNNSTQTNCVLAIYMPIQRVIQQMK